MKAEITNEALLYIVLMVIVIFVGVTYITGSDIMSLFNKDKLSQKEWVGITLANNMPNPDCTSDGKYKATIIFKLDYEGPPRDVELLPILDIGNNPVRDTENTVIYCTYDDSSKEHQCGSTRTLDYIMDQAAAKDFTFLGSPANVQMMIFRKTEGVRFYVNDKISSHTSSNLIASYTDFFVRGIGVGVFTKSCFASFQQALCPGKDSVACQATAGCYVTSNLECKPCRTTNIASCDKLSGEECISCANALGKKCKRDIAPKGGYATCRDG